MAINGTEFGKMMDRRLEEAQVKEGVTREAIRSRIELPAAADPMRRTPGQYITDFTWRVRAETKRLRENRGRWHRHLNCGND